MLQQGCDPTFDRVLQALGSIAKHRSRAVTDAVMIWRKVKSEPLEMNFLRSLM
jgi:hypothetical protein